MVINILNVNEAPIISKSSFSVNENNISVGNILATDEDGDGLSYTITGGADSSKFTIDNLGNLYFNFITDFENPSDSNSDNIYQVEVTVSDFSLQDTELLTIDIVDVPTIKYQSIVLIDITKPRDVFVVDLNRDGILDLIITESNSNKIYYYKNDGNMVYTKYLVGDSYNPNYLNVKDIDNDGNLDIVNSYTKWYKYNGVNNFTLMDEVHSNYKDKYNQDINNNGTIDTFSSLMTGSTNPVTGCKGYDVFWVEDNGTKYKFDTVPGQPTNIFSGDINNDGNMDIVLNNDPGCYKNTTLYLNDGSQHFTEKKVFENLSIKSLYVKDINHDGKKDIIASTSNPYSITAAIQQEDASFVSFEINNMNGSGGIFAIDIDNDGDVDIISVSEQDNKIILHKNISDIN